MWMEEENQAVIEAILFASGTAVEKEKLAKFLKLGLFDLQVVLEAMQDAYKAANRGIELLDSENSVKLATKPQLTGALDQWFKVPGKRLSAATLETLAVIAYEQPVTRAEIEDIRGVRSDKAVQSLLEKDLIKEAGSKEAPGRPALFVTTQTFLEGFGLKSLADLPALDKENMDSTK